MIENFFFNGNFFNDLYECCNYQCWDKDELSNFSDDFEIEIELTDLEPIFELSPKIIIEQIDELRFSEFNYDNEADRIIKVLNENIDFDKINKLIQKMYYINGNTQIIKKAELIESI